MTLDRRDLLFGALAGAGLLACHHAAKPVMEPATKSILVLGGTGFLGPHVVTAAQARGHTLTLFNRGKTHPGMFPGIEKLLGDRDGKLDALRGRTWDAVVDTSGFVPRIVKMSADTCSRRTWSSTSSSRRSRCTPTWRRSAPTRTAARSPRSRTRRTRTRRRTTARSRRCASRPPRRRCRGAWATLRPGLIVGPGDPTGRYTHWPVRMAEGGDVLAPGDGTTPRAVDRRPRSPARGSCA